jgi:hypothetical protein
VAQFNKYSMQYLKEAKSNTPYVSIDTELGKFQIIGVSNCDNAKEFFEPIVNCLDNLTGLPLGKFHCVFQFDELFHEDSKMILFIFQKLKSLQIDGWDITIDWNLMDNNPYLFKIAEDFEYMIDIKININDLSKINSNILSTFKNKKDLITA